MLRSAIVAVGAALVLGLSACGGDDDDGETVAPPPQTEPVQTQTTPGGAVQLEQLNDSGVTGSAELQRETAQLRVNLQASEATPNQQHLAHIHIPEQGEAECPGEDADEDGDGLISLEEGAPAYGPVVVEFEPFPEADAEGNITYERTLDVEENVEIERGAVVVHGLEVEGEYQAAPPVACGVIE